MWNKLSPFLSNFKLLCVHTHIQIHPYINSFGAVCVSTSSGIVFEQDGTLWDYTTTAFRQYFFGTGRLCSTLNQLTYKESPTSTLHTLRDCSCALLVLYSLLGVQTKHLIGSNMQNPFFCHPRLPTSLSRALLSRSCSYSMVPSLGSFIRSWFCPLVLGSLLFGSGPRRGNPVFSLQHALAMVGGVITVPLLVAGGFDANL